MTLENDAYAYLRITGAGSVNSIIEKIGLEPDEGWSEGDPRRRGGGEYTFSYWGLHSGERKGVPLDTHLRSLWRRIEPYEQRLVQLRPEYSRSLVCVAWFPNRDAEFTIAAGHFSTAAYYRLVLDFDFYYVDDFGDRKAGKGYASW